MPLVTEVGFQSGLGDTRAAAGASEIQVKRRGLGFHGQGYREATSEMPHWMDGQTDTIGSQQAAPQTPAQTRAFLKHSPPHPSSSGLGCFAQQVPLLARISVVGQVLGSFPHSRHCIRQLFFFFFF